MKPHHFVKVSVTGLLVLSASCSLMLIVGCEKEKSTTETENLSNQTVLVEQQLALLEFENGNRMEFRTESDGIVCEMTTPVGAEEVVSETLKKEGSPLRIFLSLTDKTIPVPEDLLLNENDEKLLALARSRGLTKNLGVPVQAKQQLTSMQKNKDLCSGNSDAFDFFETIPAPKYYKFFENYSATVSGTDVYSSAHPSANQCRRAVIDLANCADASGRALEVKLYKKFGGIYYLQNTVDIPDGTVRYYIKSYNDDHYQKINVQTSSSSNSANRFGGYILYSDYN